MHFVELFAKFSRRVLPKRRICLVYWRPPTGTNFGDEMSWHVVARLLERYGKSAVALEPCTGQRRYACRVLAIGSILHLARDGDIVWGSGLNGKIGVSGYDFSAIQFRAVRGPLTREFVQRNGGVCPEIYGDPGLLVPALFPELLSERRAGEQYAVSYLPNINDAATDGLIVRDQLERPRVRNIPQGPPTPSSRPPSGSRWFGKSRRRDFSRRVPYTAWSLPTRSACPAARWSACSKRHSNTKTTIWGPVERTSAMRVR